MNVLITNLVLCSNSGTELYVKELSIELTKRGYQVEIYTFVIGALARELKNKNINVVDKLSLLKNVPDIIHAHHNIVASKVSAHFRKTPIIYFIHDRTSTYDYPFLHKNVIKYVAVDYNCKERYYLESEFNEDEIQVIFNWFNPQRFFRKNVINDTPKKALIFSNYIDKGSIYHEIQSACLDLGITVDIIGAGSGNPNGIPEKVLSGYDIVFGKAKAGIEAMATGAALIVCDYRGLGGMVTSENVEIFRKFNFGMKLMTKPVKKELIIAEINNYNSDDIDNVTNFIRDKSGLFGIVSEIEDLYKNAIAEFQLKGKGNHQGSLATRAYIQAINYKISIKLYLNKHPLLYRAVKMVYKF